MKRMKIGIFGLCCLSLSSYGGDIDSVINSVIESDFKVKSLTYQEKAYDYRVQQEKAKYKPKASVNVLFGWDKYKPYYMDRFLEQQLGYYYISISQPVYDPEILSSIKQSRHYKEISSIKVKQQKEYVAYLLVSSLQRYISAKRLVELYQELVRLAQERKEAVATLFLSKRATEEDFLQAEREFINYNARLEAKKIELDYLSRFLNSLLPSEMARGVDDFSIDYENLDYERFFADYESWRDGLKDNYEIVMAKKNIDIAKEEVDIRRYKGYPKVMVQGSYLKSTTSATTVAKEDTRVALSFDYPIYQGGYVNALVLEAQELLKSAQMDYKQIETEKERDLMDAYREYYEAYKKLGQLKLSVSKSYEIVSKSRESFQKSLITKVELLSSEIDFVNQKANYIETFSNYFDGMFKLKFLTGNILKDNNLNLIFK